MGKISEFMLREHGEIIALLSKYNKTGKSEDFMIFKDKQDRHMLGEEKAIFALYSRNKKFSVLSEIMKQHEMLHEMEDVFKNDGDKKKFKEILDLMGKHIKLEDTKFYPVLDKELDVEEQEKVIENTKKYLLGSIALG